MAIDIKALRAKLKQENQPTNTFQSDGASYPFWNIDTDSIAVTRLLPDADPENQFFWRDRLMINLEFDGVVGQTMPNTIKVQVPCMEMYGETCPILTEARKFYKDGRDELGQKYWKKKSHIFQGFVRQNPLKEENVPENPIRRFTFNTSIFKKIYAYLLDDDTENSPTDYELGADFRIKKTQNGTYADYSTSDFARKVSALTDEELEAIEKHGLYNLMDFLPKKPDAETLNVIQQMFEASLNGDAYDPSRFAAFYRPAGLEFDASTTRKNVEKAPSKVDEDDVPFATNSSNEDTGEKKKLSPQELLQKLKKANS